MPKKSKSKLNLKAPRELVIMKNADKKHHEFYKEGDHHLRLPHPFRLCILGNVGSGKSNIVKNILMVAQAKKPKFKEVWIVHGDVQSKEYNEIEPTCIRSTIPSIDELDPDIKKLIVIDDYEFSDAGKEQMRRLSELYRFGSSHRSTSIILSHQSAFGVPKIVKDLSNVFLIYKMTDLDSMKTLGRRLGLKKEEIIHLYREYMPNFRDNIMINMIPNAPHKYLRNLYEPIDFKEES